MTPTTLILSLAILAPGQTNMTCPDGNCLRFPNAANLPMTGLTVVASSDPAYARAAQGRARTCGVGGQCAAAGRPIVAVPVSVPVVVESRTTTTVRTRVRVRRGLFGLGRWGRR